MKRTLLAAAALSAMFAFGCDKSNEAPTPEAQKIFVGKGYRPVVKDTPGADKFPEPADLFDITKFGGWEEVNADFFDPQNGVVAKIFQDQGKSTESG